MLPPGRDDQAGDARADAPGLSPCRQQANFSVGVRPVAAPQEVAGVFRSALDPGEGGSFVGEASGFDDIQRIGQMGIKIPLRPPGFSRHQADLAGSSRRPTANRFRRRTL